jgi:phosphoribosylformylglycinamidine cyclo-ligase
VLPKGCDAVIRKGTWDVLPIFQLMASQGGVPEAELYQVFNMGIGMVVIAAPEKARAMLQTMKREGYRAWNIGEIVRGKGVARVE